MIVIRDRIGRYIFISVRGPVDCCGFVYRIIGRSVK